jgi:YaiO family outer membrane protein
VAQTNLPAAVPAAAPAAAPAAPIPTSIPAPTPIEIDTYASYQSLSAGYGQWSETGVLATDAVGANVFQGQLATMRRFGTPGKYAGFGDTLTINPDWYASLNVGAGDGAFYLPRYRVDAFINRKLLAQKNLVATLGLSDYLAPDGHTDRSVGLGAIYYFTQPLVVQGEVRFNNSSPGSVNTRQQFIAATWGYAKKTQIIGRYAWGMEGYQTIGAGVQLVDFYSTDASLAVRHWIGPNWGVSAMLERYRNPYYDRQGVTLGLFWQL